jgi:hypothetical protein
MNPTKRHGQLSVDRNYPLAHVAEAMQHLAAAKLHRNEPEV